MVGNAAVSRLDREMEVTTAVQLTEPTPVRNTKYQPVRVIVPVLITVTSAT